MVNQELEHLIVFITEVKLTQRVSFIKYSVGLMF
jgi:hypothetical protein